MLTLAKPDINISTSRILIIDDNADMNEYLSSLLKENWLVDTVNTSQAALELIENLSQAYDLILTNNIQLPYVLKKNPNSDKIPVIVISALREEPRIEELLEAGADDYLIRPVATKKLILRIKIQLELFKQRKALMRDLQSMTRLHSIATRFVQQPDVSIILLEILDAAIAITNADKGHLQLFDEDLNILKIVTSRGFSQPYLDHFAFCGKGTCNTTILNAKRTIVEDITVSPIFAGTPDLAFLLAEGIHAVQSTPLKNISGKIVGVLSTHYKTAQTPEPRDLQMMDLLSRLAADIIERGNWMKEREEWVEKLRETDRRKDNFLAVLSHELRNPLASISNSIFILSNSSAKNDATLRAQSTIVRQVKQISRLVDDLLDVTRITRNKILLKLQFVDINKLVYRTVEDHRLLFEQANISLHTQLAKQSIMTNIDSTRIAQVVGNLLHNALKFTENGGETFVIVEPDEQFKHVLIRVKDSGMGIEPSLLKNIFKPFMQADRTLDRSKGGLGLGLALVKGLVDQHGGTSTIVSEGPGKGTEVIIKLPLLDIGDDETSFEKSHKIKQNNDLHVLLIEDNEDVSESLRDVLDIYGYRVSVAKSGPDGIRKARAIKPDFVLCDIGLPDMNGFEVAKIFKQDLVLQSIFLIGLSGYAQLEDIDKAYEVGFDHYLAKPLNLDTLNQLLVSRFEQLSV